MNRTKSAVKQTVCLFLILVTLVSPLTSCGDSSGSKLLSFSMTESINELYKYNGEQVTIIGYMSTLSPLNGSFMYLMNLPYQSCPFCIPNTTQLSNTIAVYAPNGKEFDFTDRAIRVTGTLTFGDYTDEYGYSYTYRITNATYDVLDTSDLSDTLRLWQALASTDVIAKVYEMYNYVDFLCYWPSYTASFGSGSDYLSPESALYLIEIDGAQYNYAFKEGYFDDLIRTVKLVDETAFADLVKNIENAKAFCEKAYNELKNGNYKQVSEYDSAFQDGRKQYKLNNQTTLQNERVALYTAFSTWLSSWEI